MVLLTLFFFTKFLKGTLHYFSKLSVNYFVFTRLNFYIRLDE